MNYSSQDCFRAATAALEGKLSEAEVLDAFERIAERRARIEAASGPTGADEKLRKFAAEEAERTRIAAAVQRRHLALNVLVREQQLTAMRSQIAEGRTPAQALSASMLGTQKGIKGGRQSFLSMNQAFEDKYVDGGLLASIFSERPHIQALVDDKAFDLDVTREMGELRQGGTPGITGNSDAQFVAKKSADFLELSRLDGNKLGASTGKLDGYFGPQNHDPDRLLTVSPDTWADIMLARIDIERTFPEVLDRSEMVAILKGTYYKITTGFAPNKVSAAEAGKRIGPANLANSLGKERVYHFKSVEDATAYREQFGHGRTIDGIVGHLRRVAHVNAALKTFGPNPEVMFGHLKESLKRDISENAALSPSEKAKQTRELDDGFGILKYGIDSVTGAVNRPGNITLATIGAELRTLQSLSKLGSMIFSQVGDTVTPAIAAAFRGGNPLGAWTDQVSAIMRGRPKGEVADITYLLGEALDGLTGHIINAHAAEDTRLGFLTRNSTGFFKWTGSNWWTDVTRGAAVRSISAEMAMHAGRHNFAGLPPTYRHFLGLHGIDAAKWEAIRQANTRIAEGKAYITPDRINELPDSAIEPLIARRVAAARLLKVGANEKVAQLFADARDDLVMTVRRLFADETNYAILRPDAASTRFTTLGGGEGLRRGTWGGEAVRLIAQFKSFPVAFTQRVMGRAVYGHRKDATAGEIGTHIGTLVTGLMVAGYLSMTLKDLAKGYWPPRNIADGRTILASFLQSGAAGIYGDFLFGESDRFGGGLAESLLGPTIGGVLNLVEIGKDARDAAMTGGDNQFSGAKAFSWLVGNNPVWPLNLWYTRAALDYLVLNSTREALSPGYLRRQARNRERDYGQSRWLPQAMGR